MRYLFNIRTYIILGLSLFALACGGANQNASDPALTFGDDSDGADSGTSCSDPWCGDDAVTLLPTGTESGCNLDFFTHAHYTVYQDIEDDSTTDVIVEVAMDLASGIAPASVNASAFSLQNTNGTPLTGVDYALVEESLGNQDDEGTYYFSIAIGGMPATETSYTVSIAPNAVTCSNATTSTAAYSAEIEVYKIYDYYCDGLVCQIVE